VTTYFFTLTTWFHTFTSHSKFITTQGITVNMTGPVIWIIGLFNLMQRQTILQCTRII